MKKIQPHGSWASPITAEMIASASVRLGDIAMDGKNIYWLESRPSENGRNTMMRCDSRGSIAEILPAPYNARTRVHEYGGGAMLVKNGDIFFSNDKDRQIYRFQPGHAPQRLSNAPNSRFADFALDESRQRLIVIREEHAGESSEPENTIAALSLNGDGEIRTLVSGADFYSNPIISPDATRLAWLCWRHPNMPWDGTELWLADIQADGSLKNPRQIAGGENESIFQPRWSPDGVLYFVSDLGGWWNLYRLIGEKIEPLLEMDAEFGLPQWVFGMSTYAFSADEIICTFSQNGVWRLGKLAVGNGASNYRFERIKTDLTYITQMRAAGTTAVFSGASPTMVNSLFRLDIASGQLQVLRKSSRQSLAADDISRPETLRFDSDGHHIHAFFYPPKNRRFAAPESEKPPLMVICHSGPTAATDSGLRLKTQYWTSRGFAVLDVNYRGSTGFGRAYRDLLNGNWGVADVADCVNGAKFLAEQGRVDKNRMVISGGSAGGFTVLAALTFYDVFTAGCSRYGISDLEALTRHTHKFEARYNDRLIAAYPENSDVYRQRSPIYHADRLTAPVIFFQGSDDKVVLPEQSRKMAAVLRKKGLPVAYVLFDGEGHGFRLAKNIKRALAWEFYFYGKIFGFAPAKAIENLTIENL